MDPPRKGSRQGVLAAAWFTALLLGSVALGAYSHTPGPRGTAPSVWPADDLGAHPGRAVLVLFAHPGCPCTAASFEAAETLAREADGALDVVVYFTHPPGEDHDWRSFDLYREVRASRLAEARPDPGGHIARASGAETSGHALLFLASGALAYDGGLTPSRGHIGAFRGTAAIREALVHPPETTVRTAVFGCALQDPQPLDS